MTVAAPTGAGTEPGLQAGLQPSLLDAATKRRTPGVPRRAFSLSTQATAVTAPSTAGRWGAGRLARRAAGHRAACPAAPAAWAPNPPAEWQGCPSAARAAAAAHRVPAVRPEGRSRGARPA